MESFLLHLLKRIPQKPQRGFTLVELMVVLVIIIVITSIALFGQSSFDRSLILTDTAYTVAFSVHQAQSLGLSSRSAGGITNAGYGIHVDVPVNTTSPAPTSYFIFADTDPAAPGLQSVSYCPGHGISSGPEARPGNCAYDMGTEGPGPSSPAKEYKFNQGFRISKFCYTVALATDARGYKCSSDSRKLSSVDITYLRPSTQSVIVATPVSGSRFALPDVTLYVSSPDGTVSRCVTVTKAGQITVKNCP